MREAALLSQFLNLRIFQQLCLLYLLLSLFSLSVRFKDVNDYLSLERIIEENKRLRDRLETNGKS